MLCKVDSQTDGTFKLKCVTVILGILDVILASLASCGARKDVYFLVTVLVVVTVSLLHLICALLDVFKANYMSRGVEFLFHLLGGIAVIAGSIIILTGTDSKTSCNVMEKTSAATVGIFNGVVYLYVCRLIFEQLRRKIRIPGSGSKQSSQDPGSLPLYIFCGISRAPAVFSCAEDENGDSKSLSLSASVPTKVRKSDVKDAAEIEEKKSMLKA